MRTGLSFPRRREAGADCPPAVAVPAGHVEGSLQVAHHIQRHTEQRLFLRMPGQEAERLLVAGEAMDTDREAVLATQRRSITTTAPYLA